MGREIRVLTGLCAIATVLVAAPAAHAATITVDGFSGDETTPSNGSCALREAVINANNDNETSFPECDFDTTTPFGADTITIGTSITLSLNGDDDLGAVGDLDITDDLTLQGTTNLTLQADNSFTYRLIEVPSGGADLTLNDFKLQNADLTTLETGESAEGGAIRFVGDITSQLTLSNMRLTQNGVAVNGTPNRGGAVHATGTDSSVAIQNGTVIDVNDAGLGTTTSISRGGGISVLGTRMDLSVSGGSGINNNSLGGSSTAGGGGILYGPTGAPNTLTLTDATIDGNIAGGGADETVGDGGGILVEGGNSAVNVTDSVITTNQAGPGQGGGGGGSGTGGGISVQPTGSNVVLDNVTVDQNTAGGNGGNGTGMGGGIFTSADLEVRNGSVISANDAGVRVGGGTAIGAGGGIHVPGGAGEDQDLTIANSTITGNTAGTAQGVGGGINMLSNGDLTISDSTISLNESASASGGIQRSDHDGGAQPTDSILRSTLEENSAGSTAGAAAAGAAGGMTAESSGAITIDSSTFKNNRTSGPIGATNPGFGGGLVATSALDSPAPGSGQAGSIAIVNSTFSDNRAGGPAGGDGGGLATVVDGDHLQPNVAITATTFTENEADFEADGGQGGNVFLAGTTPNLVDIRGSIIESGLGDTGDQNCELATLGLIDSLGGSVEGPAIGPFPSGPTSQCELDAAGDVSADPLLGPLALNAPGTTATHAIAAGSPAIDRYSAGCPASDQRGVARPQGAACDAGAYEGPDAAPPETTITKQPKNKVKAKKKKKKLTWEFASSEAGATFRCRVDGKEFVVCVSPFSIKLKKGKHHFDVFSVDPAGNADASAAGDDVKVKRKKKKK